MPLKLTLEKAAYGIMDYLKGFNPRQDIYARSCKAIKNYGIKYSPLNPAWMYAFMMNNSEVLSMVSNPYESGTPK